MVLIGITGTKGSGKGAVASFVAEWANERGLLAVDRGFADKLKWAMARIFWPKISMEDALVWANEFKNLDHAHVLIGDLVVSGYEEFKSISGRELFQHGGTEMGRDVFGENFWVDQLLPLESWQANFRRMILPITELQSADVATISDLRFPNEARRIARLGGSMWEVRRPGFESDGHASEMPLERKLISASIDNNGNLISLRKKVYELCDEVIGGGRG